MRTSHFKAEQQFLSLSSNIASTMMTWTIFILVAVIAALSSTPKEVAGFVPNSLSLQPSIASSRNRINTICSIQPSLKSTTLRLKELSIRNKIVLKAYSNNDYYYEDDEYDYEYEDDYTSRERQQRRFQNEKKSPRSKLKAKIPMQEEGFQIPSEQETTNTNDSYYYRIDVEVLSATNLLPTKDVLDTSDAYAKISIGSVSDQTNVVFNIQENTEVVWNERMDFYIPFVEKECEPPENIMVQVWDWDANTRDELLGLCMVPLRSDMFVPNSNEEEEEELFVEKTLQLYNPEEKDDLDCGNVKIRYRCRLWKEQNEDDSNIIGDDEAYDADDEASIYTINPKKAKQKQKQKQKRKSYPKQNDYYDDDDEDYYDDDENEMPSAPGNFWSNPKPGLDPYPSERQQQQEGRRRRSSRIENDLPPTTADPSEWERRRPSSPRRRRRQSEEKYGIPPSSRTSTFRSGAPPPPKPLKELYDRFFWYGFDSEDTTSPADRTMFGGTRGKFNGLELLRGRDEGEWDTPRRKRVWDDELGRYVDSFEYEDGGSRRRGRQQRRRQDYYDDDDDEYEIFDEDINDFDEEEWGLKSKKSKRVRPDTTPTLPPGRRDERDMFPPSPSSSSRRQDRRRQKVNYYEDEVDDGEEYRRRLADAFQRKMRSKRKEADWVSGEVSTWFETKPARRGDYDYDEGDLYVDDEDDYDDYVMEKRRGDQRMRRAGSKKNSRGPWDLTSILDAVFDLDTDVVDAKAKEYDFKTGRRKREGSGMRRDDIREERRRKGFAYRYVDDDGSPPVADYELVDAGEEITVGDVSGKAVIDKDQKLSSTENPQNKRGSEDGRSRQTEKRDPVMRKPQRSRRKRSWEERARDVDRVPPSGVTAWGPEGEVKGGIDARSQAALDAMEEIRDAKRVLEKKEEKVIDAEEMVIVAKTDANLQRKRMEARREELGTSKMRENLRMINAGVDNAARALRRARAEVQSALNEVEELEDRHWALLSEFDAEEELETEQGARSEFSTDKTPVSVTEKTVSGDKESIEKTISVTAGDGKADYVQTTNSSDMSTKNIDGDSEDIIDLDKADEHPKK